MAHKTKIGGTAYEISGGRTLIDGTGYSIDKGRAKVGGTGYDISFGTPIGSLSVGSSVFFNVNGTPYEFIVVHQGNPDPTIYDESCDGTWLLMKDVIASMKAGSNNNYENSDLHSYVNNSLITMFGGDIQSAIKQVKIPYTNGLGLNGSLATGSSGLDTRMFLLSYTETGFSGESWANVEGAVLDYFNGASNADRIAYRDGNAIGWWLRSPSTHGNTNFVRVTNTGSAGTLMYTSATGVRPAFILPSDFDVTNYLA